MLALYDAGHRETGRDVRPCNPKGIGGVSAMERTAGGKLRPPSFKRFRDMEGSEGVEA